MTATRDLWGIKGFRRKTAKQRMLVVFSNNDNYSFSPGAYEHQLLFSLILISTLDLYTPIYLLEALWANNSSLEMRCAIVWKWSELAHQRGEGKQFPVRKSKVESINLFSNKIPTI